MAAARRIDLRRASREACAPAAKSHLAATAPPIAAAATSCCCVTSAARWSATRACCCTSLMVSRTARARVEVFLFATGLTRVTRQMRRRRLDAAVDAVSDAVPDWSGGTRIGEALRQFHQRWARRVLHQAPVVLLISDGWDRGDPHVLREQVARLQRSCHRLIWLNPLIGTVELCAADSRPSGRAAVRRRFLGGAHAQGCREFALHLRRRWRAHI